MHSRSLNAINMASSCARDVLCGKVYDLSVLKRLNGNLILDAFIRCSLGDSALSHRFLIVFKFFSVLCFLTIMDGGPPVTRLVTLFHNTYYI